jgi:hypothetical protein
LFSELQSLCNDCKNITAIARRTTVRNPEPEKQPEAEPIPQRTPPEELAAIGAVQRYNRAANNPRVIKSIPLQSAGGQLCLVEFNEPNGNETQWPVIVRGSRADVYYDWEFAIADATGRRWFFDFFSADVVLALLSFGILATVIIMFFNTTPHAVPEVFAAALTTVLGFWFGKLTR